MNPTIYLDIPLPVGDKAELILQGQLIKKKSIRSFATINKLVDENIQSDLIKLHIKIQTIINDILLSINNKFYDFNCSDLNNKLVDLIKLVKSDSAKLESNKIKMVLIKIEDVIQSVKLFETLIPLYSDKRSHSNHQASFRGINPMGIFPQNINPNINPDPEFPVNVPANFSTPTRILNNPNLTNQNSINYNLNSNTNGNSNNFNQNAFAYPSLNNNMPPNIPTNIPSNIHRNYYDSNQSPNQNSLNQNGFNSVINNNVNTNRNGINHNVTQFSSFQSGPANIYTSYVPNLLNTNQLNQNNNNNNNNNNNVNPVYGSIKEIQTEINAEKVNSVHEDEEMPRDVAMVRHLYTLSKSKNPRDMFPVLIKKAGVDPEIYYGWREEMIVFYIKRAVHNTDPFGLQTIDKSYTQHQYDMWMHRNRNAICSIAGSVSKNKDILKDIEISETIQENVKLILMIIPESKFQDHAEAVLELILLEK